MKGCGAYGFLDFFAGIGLFRLGLEQAGMVCRGHCEIDKYANMSYDSIHEVKEGEWFAEDIRQVNGLELPDVALWALGFPCQDLSLAGKRTGLHGARSGLFFEIIRLLEERGENKPRWVALENVKGLLSSSGSRDFGLVLYSLAELGYGVEYAVLNSKDFGVPQNRERVYIICDITRRSTGKIFPVGGTNAETLKQVIGGSQGGRVYDPNGIATTIAAGSGGVGAKTGLYFVAKDDDKGLVYKNVCGTIDAGYYKGMWGHQQRTGVLHSKLPKAILNPDKKKTWQNGRRMKNEDEEMFTLTTTGIHGILLESRIRRLTPLETWRLQGVPDELFYKAQAVCSETQLYKQAGNAVTVPVVKAVGDRIREYLVEEKETETVD